MNKYSFPVKNLLLITGLISITLVSTLISNYVKAFERSLVLEESKENRIIVERAVVEGFIKIPVADYLHYIELKIYAEFVDDKSIPRTSPWLTKPNENTELKKFYIDKSKIDRTF